ncbi:MAG: hypothetical protein KAG84_01005 [Bacteroidales bacterium]|nr:hypothetical protein [Bacteroidales bacterium]
MHIMKVKGSGNIPNYIQFRDDNFALLSYFKASTYVKALAKDNLQEYTEDIALIIENMQYGELYYIKNKN